VMHSGGTGIHRFFARAGAFPSRPSWSPDGRWIAFGLQGENDDGGSIVVVRSTGGDARYVTDGRSVGGPDGQGQLDPGVVADDYEPDWSPDGTRLAFTRIAWSCPGCDMQEVFSVRADGSDVHWITTDPSYNDVNRPLWSPSGSRIVAESDSGIVIFTAAGKLLRVLDPYGIEPAWQPLN
jgi:Tol biopolymer transport system component